MSGRSHNATPNKKQNFKKARKNFFEERTVTSPSRIGEKATQKNASTASLDIPKTIKNLNLQEKYRRPKS